MKTPKFVHCLIGALTALLILFSGWVTYSSGGGVTQIYKNATAPFVDEKKVDSALSIPDGMVVVKTPYQGGRFWTETRTDKIERFKCSQCHNNNKVNVDRAAEMAHGVIALDHGGQEKPLSCFTCHKEDERDFLESEQDVKVDMDHSYQLCDRCHFRQKKDWVGGAHGKRISNWAGKRVVQNCTSCHNPHSPLFKKRWPKTYSPPF
jgi:hypothetical protein